MEQPTAGESVENQHFRVMNRAFVRSAVELNSSRQGTVEVGEEIEALESAVFNGTVRVRFSRGWVSQNAELLQWLPWPRTLSSLLCSRR